MNVIYRRHACLVAAFVVLVGQAIFASAQTLLVDFGNDATYRSLSVINPDSKGNFWNSIQPGVLTMNLVDLHNSATTIDIGWDTPVGFDSFNGPAGPTGPEDDKQMLRANDLPFTDIDAAALGNLGGALEAAFDFAAGPSLADNRVRFQIQQLDPTKKYNLTFFGSHIFSNNTTTDYSVYADNTYSTSVGMTSLDVQEPDNPGLHNRDRVASINNLSPQADNILYVQFVGSSGGLGYLNAMQIEAVTSALAGDYNGNGSVDAADYVLWRKGGPLQNEVADPGTVSAADYGEWRARFGNSMTGSASGGISAVPEPAAVALILAAAISMLPLRRRR